MTKRDRIQHLLISHLLEEGQIAINLPNGFVLEVGVTKENKNGDLEKTDDYCWAIVSDKDRVISMDSFNLGLRFADDETKFIFEDSGIDTSGNLVKILDVV